MSIKQPPTLPNLSAMPDALRDYLQRVDEFLRDAYAQIRNISILDVAITSTTGAPTGGQDGDVHIRKSGATTAIYLNINGAWSAYTNP